MRRQGSFFLFVHSLSIFRTKINARRKRSYSTCCALVSADAAFEDASVGPEVYSFARIERAYSKWPQSACKTRGARRPIQKKKKKKKSKAMTEARRNERAKCAAKVKERSGTRRRQARTPAADGGRQR